MKKRVVSLCAPKLAEIPKEGFQWPRKEGKAMEIKNWNGETLFADDSFLLRNCIENALKAEVSLSGANFSAADLRRVNLSGGDFSGADFRGANLNGANLSGTNLSGANLRHAVGLTKEQIESAVTDEKTQLPNYLTVSREAWLKEKISG